MSEQILHRNESGKCLASAQARLEEMLLRIAPFVDSHIEDAPPRRQKWVNAKQEALEVHENRFQTDRNA